MANIKAINGQVISVNTKEVLATVPTASSIETSKDFVKASLAITTVVSNLVAELGSMDLVPASILLRQEQILRRTDEFPAPKARKAKVSLVEELIAEEPTAEVTAPVVADITIEEESKAADQEEVAEVSNPSVVHFGEGEFDMKKVKDFNGFNALLAAVTEQGKKVVLAKTGEQVELIELYEFKISKRPSVAVKTTGGKRKDYYIDVAHRYLAVAE